nr:hypothetical protein GTC16762_12390 [Pigmentibacter ruber]
MADIRRFLFFKIFDKPIARDRFVNKIKNETTLKPKILANWLIYISECIKLPNVQLKKRGAIISNKTIIIAIASVGSFLVGCRVDIHVLKIKGEKIKGKYNAVKILIPIYNG